MEKIGIEKIRCFNPLGFYACWMVVLWWMTMSIVTWGYCPLLDLIGLMGFGAIFLMIAGTFGTVSVKKVFLCNVYDGVAKYYKKVLGYEALILLLSLGLAFDMSFVSNNGYNPFSIYSWGGILIYVVYVRMLFCYQTCWCLWFLVVVMIWPSYWWSFWSITSYIRFIGL